MRKPSTAKNFKSYLFPLEKCDKTDSLQSQHGNIFNCSRSFFLQVNNSLTKLFVGLFRVSNKFTNPNSLAFTGFLNSIFSHIQGVQYIAVSKFLLTWQILRKFPDFEHSFVKFPEFSRSCKILWLFLDLQVARHPYIFTAIRHEGQLQAIHLAPCIY